MFLYMSALQPFLSTFRENVALWVKYQEEITPLCLLELKRGVYNLWETWSSHPVPFFSGRNGEKTAFPPGASDTIFGRIKIPRWFVSDIIYPAPTWSRLTLLMRSAGGQGGNWGEQVGRKHSRTRPSPLQCYLYHRLTKTSLSYVFTRFRIHHLILVIAYKIIYELPTPRRIRPWWI